MDRRLFPGRHSLRTLLFGLDGRHFFSSPSRPVNGFFRKKSGSRFLFRRTPGDFISFKDGLRHGLDFGALASIPGFVTVLILLALASKFIGAGLPAYAVGLSTRESLMVGIGMSGRGAVELIVAGGGELYACKLATDMFGLTKDDFHPDVKDIITVGDLYEMCDGPGTQIIFT